MTPNWLSATRVAHCHRIIAVGAVRARAEAPAPGVAVVAALGAEVAGLALWAFVDGVDLGGLGGAGCCPPAAPGGLAAGVGAPTAVSDGGEVGAALPAHCRRGIVTHAGHGGVLPCVGWPAGRCEMPGMSRCFTRP